MSDHIERFPFIEASLDLRDKKGDLVLNVPCPPEHSCALPPGWVTLRVGCPARTIYQGPFPTAEEIWQKHVRPQRDVSHDGRWGRRGVRR